MRIYYVSQPEAKELAPNKFYQPEEAIEKAKEIAYARQMPVRVKVNADGLVLKYGTALPDGTFFKVGDERKVILATAQAIREEGNEKFASELEELCKKL